MSTLQWIELGMVAMMFGAIAYMAWRVTSHSQDD
jgi:hypothetical protein